MCNLFNVCSVEVRDLRVTAYAKREVRSSTPPSPTRATLSKSKMVFTFLLIPIPSPLRMTKRFHRGSLVLILVVRILTNILSFIESRNMLKEATLMCQLHFRLVSLSTAVCNWSCDPLIAHYLVMWSLYYCRLHWGDICESSQLW